MLKSIFMVWVLAQNLALTQEAYEDYLGYRSVDEGVMSAELAAAIDRPELADRRFVTMMPRSGPQVGLRLVEGDASGYEPMKRVGWSAIELLVQDPEQLETELAGSAFTHLQGPDFLTDLEASLSFWRRHFDTSVVGPIPYRIGVLSDAYDLPQDTLHPLALVSMSDGYGIEIDQYPEGATAVPAPEGERGGVILVSLSVDPEGLKAPLPWRLPYVDKAGAVEGGVITLPSGTPIEISLTTAMLPAPAP